MDLIDAARPVVRLAGGEESSPARAEQAAYDLIDFAREARSLRQLAVRRTIWPRSRRPPQTRRHGREGLRHAARAARPAQPHARAHAAEQSDATEIETLPPGSMPPHDACVQAHGYYRREYRRPIGRRPRCRWLA